VVLKTKINVKKANYLLKTHEEFEIEQKTALKNCGKLKKCYVTVSLR
jgi:hypothetical protein